MARLQWKTHNSKGKYRVVVTKPLVGDVWLETLLRADCRVDQCLSERILSRAELREAIGSHCDGVIGQLTEPWDDELMRVLKSAGGKVYSNVAVGYDNVDVAAATRHGLAVGNTPGVLTETTAEMAVALTFAAGRRIVEADAFMRAGKYKGWLPTMFLGKLFYGKTLGLIGAGRIGSVFALTMARGCHMDIVYYDQFQNEQLERKVRETGSLYQQLGERSISIRRADTVEEVLETADVVSLHTILDASTRHIINAERLRLMKKDAILVNCGRGPLIDERALVQHCRQHPDFRVGLDVFENEPQMAPGLASLPNVVVVPHIASATVWTRTGMCTLAAANVAAILRGEPVWNQPDVLPFVNAPSVDAMPRAAPSIVNAKELHLPQYTQMSRL
ncbi:hypothetical protein F1559_004021 [Cyanidiococcus yangmingshanensis]|uniref:Glyoxylate reductase n=1 Tax=Cyanidiococcus yangmingshanensis TaxID=2690220 RepID=A0A7J7IK18_9RHOD|nr:hypothetical protein F1559_004021 [Cyanidiococcus yangmingshanensis]